MPKLRHLPTIVLSTTERQPLKFVRQSPPRTTPPVCPVTRIECPEIMPETGKTYTVTLHVEGLKTDADVTYNWSVSNGEILFGQGTRSLEIRVTDPAKTLTATASLGGIDPDCNVQLSPINIDHFVSLLTSLDQPVTSVILVTLIVLPSIVPSTLTCKPFFDLVFLRISAALVFPAASNL